MQEINNGLFREKKMTPVVSEIFDHVVATDVSNTGSQSCCCIGSSHCCCAAGSGTALEITAPAKQSLFPGKQGFVTQKQAFVAGCGFRGQWREYFCSEPDRHDSVKITGEKRWLCLHFWLGLFQLSWARAIFLMDLLTKKSK